LTTIHCRPGDDFPVGSAIQNLHRENDGRIGCEPGGVENHFAPWDFVAIVDSSFLVDPRAYYLNVCSALRQPVDEQRRSFLS
jgi:hypothetical protein